MLNLNNPQLDHLLGKTVEIIIDRPIGYVHQSNGFTLEYPVNYGYIPDVLGGDGEEQDVYLLGVNTPVDKYRGVVIAIIRRDNDNEDKLVAVPSGISLTESEIMDAVNFQERYFDSHIILYIE